MLVHVRLMFLHLLDFQVLHLLIELVFLLDNKVKHVSAEELFAKNKRIIMRKKPNQMQLLLLLIPYQNLITDIIMLLPILTTAHKILVDNRCKINLSFVRIVLDLLIKLV